MPPAAREQGWYVFEEASIIMVFVERSGPILSPMTSQPPLRSGMPFYGKIIIGDDVDRLLPLIDRARDSSELVARMKEAGFRVWSAPAESFRQFLDV